MNVPAVSSLSSVSLHGFLVAKAYFSVYVRFTTNLGLLYLGCEEESRLQPTKASTPPHGAKRIAI